MLNNATQPDLSEDVPRVQAILKRMNLIHGDSLPVLRTLTGGVSASICRVDVGGAAYCLKQALPKLKVSKEWHVPVDRIFSEIAWLQTAGKHVADNVPKVLGVDVQEGVFAMEYLPDSNYKNWKSLLLNGEVVVDIGAAVGDVLGRIHRATAKDPQVRSRFRTDSNFFALRLEPYFIEAARVHPGRSIELMSLVYQTQHHPFVLVHGDVSPKNILLGPKGPVLLDAECAWYGDPAFDLAFLLNHFLLKSAHMPSRSHALLHVATAIVSAYTNHVDWEPVHELEDRVATLLPGLLLARIDGKSPAEYLGEASRKFVREFALDSLTNESSSLDKLLENWKDRLRHEKAGLN